MPKRILLFIVTAEKISNPNYITVLTMGKTSEWRKMLWKKS
jgi:hypothetical protein